jgi:hypothetical protein
VVLKVTYALPDFLFSTLRACIHFVPSQILAIDTFDADRKYPEGPTCPDSFVVEGTRQNLLILASAFMRRICL